MICALDRICPRDAEFDQKSAVRLWGEETEHEQQIVYIHCGLGIETRSVTALHGEGKVTRLATVRPKAWNASLVFYKRRDAAGRQTR